MNKSLQRLLLVLAAGLLSLLSACSLPQVSAQQRTFLNLSLEFLGQYQLPKQKFQGTPVGGLSALAYDRRIDRFYALSDDQSVFAPARFYTLKLSLGNTGIQNVQVEKVTFLKGQDGQPFPKYTIDPEGIALSPQRTVFISSEGVARNSVPPSVGEFDLQTGRLRQKFAIPQRYIPDANGDKQQRGVPENLGFEALTLNPTGSTPASGEPIRLFTATESALVQDRDPVQLDDRGNPKLQPIKCRLLHYLVSDRAPIPISEHLYQLSPPPPGAQFHGLVELLAIDQGGHFLSVERSFGIFGNDIRIFQIATGAATDTSRIVTLKGELRAIDPIKKKLLLDLKELGISLDNIEGITFGPRFPDGSQSLILVSDDNFNEKQVTQFLLFRLKGGR
ncbi:esterase-like activity of phytase family protein [Aerosakkonema funiforme]|uniref:esterase-like activity of phytase family protein n=1 Tax=Oscillatoriophycideae TaxID=1301283 RepID=UPI002AC83BFD|nr:esterase-like activity of phytase family protein [Aerosakkonema funiforme]